MYNIHISCHLIVLLVAGRPYNTLDYEFCVLTNKMVQSKHCISLPYSDWMHLDNEYNTSTLYVLWRQRLKYSLKLN